MKTITLPNNIIANIDAYTIQWCRTQHECALGEPTIGTYRYCMVCWEAEFGPLSERNVAIIRASSIMSELEKIAEDKIELTEELELLTKDYGI